MDEYRVSNRCLFDILRKEDVWNAPSHNAKAHLIYESLLSDVPDGRVTAPREIAIKRLLAFLSTFQTRWQSNQRTLQRFLDKNASWLDCYRYILLPDSGLEQNNNNLQPEDPSLPKDFQKVSYRTKLRRTDELLKRPSQELLFAVGVKLRRSGDRLGAKLLENLFGSSSKNACNQRRREVSQFLANPSVPKALSPDAVLNLMSENNFTKRNYESVRKAQAETGITSFPSYEQLKTAKQKTYPPPEHVKITETSATIKLQALLDLTVSRLGIVVEPVLMSMQDNQLQTVALICKWGSDGSSGYSKYKQKFTDPDSSDSSLYMTSVVPLQLYSTKEDKKYVIWQNPRPGSPRYCRPLRLQFTKETTDHILKETEDIKNEITALEPSNINFGLKTINVKHEMHMTMADGKLVNVLTDTKCTRACNVCQAKPSQMNKIESVIRRTPDTGTYMYGLPILHCWMRCFEYLKNIGYCLDEEGKEFKGTKAEVKQKKEERKSKIQAEFKKQLFITVDCAKEGYGSSNDGNTARIFFKNPVVSASITGIKQSIIQDCSDILHALASGYEINVEAFRAKALNLLRICISEYNFYTMSPTVHKLLVHGADIMNAFPLPIGVLTEEAQEARHKECKYCRIFNTRKTSRTACNEDMLHFCLISSDPVVISHRKIKKKTAEPLSAGVLGLLRESGQNYVPMSLGDSDDEI